MQVMKKYNLNNKDKKQKMEKQNAWLCVKQEVNEFIDGKIKELFNLI